VLLACGFSVFARMHGMTVRRMSVMRRALVMSDLLVPGRLAMMLRRTLVVVGSRMVMVRLVVHRHDRILLACCPELGT
jgi:hypothetical protein